MDCRKIAIQNVEGIFKSAVKDTFPKLRENLRKWTQHKDDTEKNRLRGQGESFLAIAESDLRRALWMVHEAEEGHAYRAVVYMENIAKHLGDMKPEHLAHDFYIVPSRGLHPSDKNDAALLSINEMLVSSKNTGNLIPLAREWGVPYRNIRTISNFWSNVSDFNTSQLTAKKSELDFNKEIEAWKSNNTVRGGEKNAWKLGFSGKYEEFGLKITNYDVSFHSSVAKGSESGIAVSEGQGIQDKEFCAGTCQVWLFEPRIDKLGPLEELLRTAPAIYPVQLIGEDKVRLVAVDLVLHINGANLRRPFISVLRAMHEPTAEFAADIKNLEEILRNKGVSPEDANPIFGQVLLETGNKNGFRVAISALYD